MHTPVSPALCRAEMGEPMLGMLPISLVPGSVRCIPFLKRIRQKVLEERHVSFSSGFWMYARTPNTLKTN